MSKFMVRTYNDETREAAILEMKQDSMLLLAKMKEEICLTTAVRIRYNSYYYVKGIDVYEALQPLLTEDDLGCWYKYLCLRDDGRILDAHIQVVLRAKPIDTELELLV